MILLMMMVCDVVVTFFHFDGYTLLNTRDEIACFVENLANPRNAPTLAFHCFFYKTNS